MFVLIFYALSPVPTLIARRFAESVEMSSVLIEICIFITSCIVVSAYGLPLVLTRAAQVVHELSLLLLNSLMPAVAKCHTAKGWTSECPDVKYYKCQLNPMWHRMLYMAYGNSGRQRVNKQQRKWHCRVRYKVSLQSRRLLGTVTFRCWWKITNVHVYGVWWGAELKACEAESVVDGLSNSGVDRMCWGKVHKNWLCFLTGRYVSK